MKALRFVLPPLVFLIATVLGAFNLEPVIMVLEPRGTGASGVFHLSNPGNRPMAVELSVLTRSQDLLGRELREPAEGMFSVFPSQLILEPGARRTVRVRWMGPADITTEYSYRLRAEQLPVDLEDDSAAGSGSIAIMLRYLAALYVRPPGA